VRSRMRIVLCFTLLVALPRAGYAEDETAIGGFGQVVTPTLERLARDSSTIARIHINSREPVHSVGSTVGLGPVCGYYYHAVVVESLKGSTTSVTFFSPANADFNGLEPDYLVFIKERLPEAQWEAINQLGDILSLGERSDLVCRNTHRYYVPYLYQAMRAFDPDAAINFGGEWLMPINRPEMRWCALMGSSLVQGEWDTRLKDVEDRASLVLNWESAKMLIIRALRSDSLFNSRC